MAKKNETETKKTTKDGAASHAKRIKLLQTSTDAVNDRIVGTSRSFTSRAIKARSVAPKVVEAAFASMEAAIAEGREEYAAAQQSDDVGRISRVDLSKL